MSALCQYCSSEVFGPAGWRKLWTSERSHGYLKLEFVRSIAELLHSVDLQCWLCRWILDKFRDEMVDFDEVLATNEDFSYEVEISPETPRQSMPETICLLYVLVYCTFYASNLQDRASMVPSPEPVRFSFCLDLGATTNPGKSKPASFAILAEGKFPSR